jgi:hypothetical protein
MCERWHRWTKVALLLVLVRTLLDGTIGHVLAVLIMHFP